MLCGPPESCEWHEEDVLEASQGPADAPVAGLPEYWRYYDWWMAGAAYSGPWLFESWTSDQSPFGPSVPARMSFGVVGLLLALWVCYGLFLICRPLSRLTGRIVSVTSGIALLVAHSISPNL
jgi:hypothetical protein